MKERTLIFMKPDVFEKRIMGKVLHEIEKRDDFKIIAMCYTRLNKEQAETFYAVHRGKPFYGDLVAYVTRGPVFAMVIEGEKAIEKMRELMGATNPTEAKGDTIRGMYGESLDANVVHGSDSPESAEIEIPFFFSKRSLI